ncbi:hypothetical protein KZ820_06655 [Sphingomonas sp. RRHST34]|uniref:DUF6894 domain-containing protein n=1 Tax=Sphingomonas citri TaxID=2862499 RepID=A0ABS7BLE6_9SPHN|nr:hypothetical protein [Sphingomonas citri]MBW6530410.1 hypothetical protein [Sphingomonas citri]
MPRFFFHVTDGVDIRDEEGTELPNLKAARRVAVQYAGALLREVDSDELDRHDWVMTVTDDTGLTMFTLNIFLMLAPSISGLGDQGGGSATHAYERL